MRIDLAIRATLRVAALLLVLAPAVCICWGVALSAPESHRANARRARADLIVQAEFLGFVEGDHVYAVFCVSGDSIITVGVSDLGAADFVAVHIGAALDVELTVIGQDTLDVDVVEPSYGLTGASLNAYHSDQWWSDVERSLGYERARKAFDALERALTADSAEDVDRLRRCKARPR